MCIRDSVRENNLQENVKSATLKETIHSLGQNTPWKLFALNIMSVSYTHLLSAVLIDYLKTAFDWIKKHYKIINGISGGLLIFIGVMMATGAFGRLMSLFS